MLYLRRLQTCLRKTITRANYLCAKMPVKLAANLNFLFTENNAALAQRIKLAHAAGFHAVEIPYPVENKNDVVQSIKETGIQVSLMNIALGEKDLSFGSTCIPGAEDAFRLLLDKTVQLAKAVNCTKIHIMAGLKKNQPFEECLQTYKNNLKHAAQILETNNMIGVIEPINPYSLPFYFLNSYEIAETVLKEVNSNHIKLMLDIFHLQLIRGNITNSFQELSNWIGHIQIAQPPHRHEPDVAGELDWNYVFQLIDQSGYKDFVGCEYKPKTSTDNALKWIKNYNVQL